MFQEYLCQKSNEDDAKLSYEVAHRLILKLAEYVTEKAANPVKVSRNIMINQNLPKLQIVFERDNLFESFVVVSLFPIDSEYESVMPQTQLEKEVVVDKWDRLQPNFFGHTLQFYYLGITFSRVLLLFLFFQLSLRHDRFVFRVNCHLHFCRKRQILQ